MYGECENCKRSNYLTEFKIFDKKWQVCHDCFKNLSQAKAHALVQENIVRLKQELRQAFGELGDE